LSFANRLLKKALLGMTWISTGVESPKLHACLGKH